MVVRRQLKKNSGGRPTYSYQVKWRYLGKGPINQSRTVDNARDAKLLNEALQDSGWAYKDTDPEVVWLTLIGGKAPVMEASEDDERADLTVGQAIEEWIGRPGLADGSVRAYTNAANRLQVLHPVLVRALTKKQVNAAFKAEEKKGASPNYLMGMRIVLNGALTDAGRPGMCEDTSYNGGRKVVPYYLRPAQEVALVKAARDRGGDRLAAAVFLTLQCGLRWGETYGLRVRHVDLDDRLLYVEEGINNGDKLEDGWGPHRLKTKAARRKVPMPDEVCAVLAPLMEGLDGEAAIFFPEPVLRKKGQRRPGVRGMAHRKAAFWTYRTFNYNWNKICKAAEGVPDALRYHDLRHTCAKRWLEAGVPIGIVSRMLGHSKIDVTHAEYGGFDTHSIDLMRNLVEAAAPGGRRLKAVG